MQDAFSLKGHRKMEHSASDLIDEGYRTLQRNELADMLRTSTERAEVMATVRRHRCGHPLPDQQHLPNPCNEEIDDSSDSDNNSDKSNSESVQSSGPVSDCDKSDGSEHEERMIGDSGWDFHIDGNGFESDNEDSEAEDEEHDEYSADPDVDVDRWATENDLPADK